MRHDYQALIKENEAELRELEKRYRYNHIGQRLHMLRLLKSGEARSVQQAADSLNYSWRQCQRWLSRYREGGLEALLIDRTSNRSKREERMTPQAWQALQQALVQGDIATYRQARVFLAEQGVHYADVSSIFRLFKRHKIKAKVGRYRHEKADLEAQEGFKKTSPTV